MKDKTDKPRVEKEPSTVRVTIKRDYWPKDQPEQLPGAVLYVQKVHRAGEVVDLPPDEAKELEEIGAAEKAPKEK